MKRVFIDGSAGTTGLRIYDRLSERGDIALVSLDEKYRKDIHAREDMLRDGCDIAFLCLPDDASQEAVEMLGDADTIILDTSTAHRTDPRFVYGFPELSAARRKAVAEAKRIAVPGCHASGFIALVYPLVEAGLLDRSVKLSCFSLTGYSGGGKKMIGQYRAEDRDVLFKAPRQYGLGQAHKHLPEMVKMTGLDHEPIFCPIVADHYSGMEVTVPVFAEYLRGSVKDIRQIYEGKYHSPIVYYRENADEDGFLSSGALSGKDSMGISVAGNDDRILLCARYDNLGKGASGAAVECLNLVLGVDETTGLVL